jgi:predicted glycosyltransferase
MTVPPEPRSAAMHVWIDIENPPQVQYLLPFRRAFEAAGAEVTVTARDYGFTYALLEEQGVRFERIGAEFGAGKARKATGLARRTLALRARLRKGPKPTAHLTAGRASALAARSMGVPTFVFGDYEHTSDAISRVTGCHSVFPDVIDRSVLLGRGFRADRLIPFPGLKEDITFAGLDLDAVPARTFAGDPQLPKVLFRPPAEDSHYYRDESGNLALATLEHLARSRDAMVIYSPRYARQVEYLSRFSWSHEPVVLDRAVPFLELLKGVDAVISGGGTMLREAAYLGVPAYTIFRGAPGAVDRHLEALGRLHVIARPEDLRGLSFAKDARLPVLEPKPRVLAELVQTILERS